MDKGNRTRRLVQLYAALLHNAYIRGFITGEIYKGNAKIVCTPGLNCYSCPGAVGACPLGALQNALASAGHRAGWYVLGILMLFGVISGRTVCGWLCPAGLIQELLHRIPTPKIRKSRATRALTWLKYGILAVFVIAIPLWYGLKSDLPLPAFCKYICPAGTLEGAGGHLANPANRSMYSMLGFLFTQKWVVMLVIALACIFCYRSFCRFLCPLGAVYSLFSRFSVIGVKVDAERCNGCGLCAGRCEMDVRHVGDRECIHCGKCMQSCRQGAISIRAGRILLKGPETGGSEEKPEEQKRKKRIRHAFAAAAAAILCFALLWFNILDPSIGKEEASVPTAEQTEEAAAGHEPGERLEDFTLTCYDGTTFHLAEQRGKVVFINLWSTWCTPCKAELPYFSNLCAEHGDAAVIAVHPSMVLDDPAAYLADQGYTFFCATDTEDDLVWGITGGSATYPQTIVLDRNGLVTWNAIGSVTPELLETLYREAADK